MMRLQGRTKERSRLAASLFVLAVSAGLAGAASFAPGQALAQSGQSYSVPAGDLDAGLRRFAEQSRIQLIYPASLTSGRRTPGIQGAMSVSDALSGLLTGTGLTFQFQDANTVTISPAPATVADDGSRILGPVRVEGLQTAYAGPPARGTGLAQLGGERGAQDDEAVGYRPVVATVGGGVPTAIEDIPRSISVITQEQFETQDINTISEALRRLPGVTLIEDGANGEGGASVTARGFGINAVQVDGAATTRLNVVGTGLLNLDAYERVEVVRGANAVFTGPGSPGGSLNLVRKRPGDVTVSEINAGIGSFGRANIGVDYSTPSLSGSAIAFRGVGTLRTQEEFYDNYSITEGLLYGIVDMPLGVRARLELGAEYSWLDQDGGYIGIPHYIDGPLFDGPLNLNRAWTGAGREFGKADVFGRFYIDLFKDWTLELGGSYQDSDEHSRFGIVTGTAASTGYASPGYIAYQDVVRGGRAMAFDAKLAGKFETGPLTHNFYVAATQTTQTSIPTSIGWARATPLTPDQWLPIPVYLEDDLFPPYQRTNGSQSTSRALVIGDTVSWLDWADFTLALRNSSNESIGFTEDVENPSDGSVTLFGPTSSSYNEAWRPNYALAIKPIRGLTFYGSYSDGFSSQEELRTTDGRRLGPATYINIEYGAKYARDLWTASLAVYSIKEENAAQQIPGSEGQCGGGPLEPCYSPLGATKTSDGIDFEIAGQIAPGFSLLASYNHNETDIVGASIPLVTHAPVDSAQLLADWTPGFLSDLSIQLGLRYRGEVYQYGYAIEYSPTGEFLNFYQHNYVAPAHVIADLGIDYRISQNWSARLFVENVLDEEYFSTIGQTQNFVGRPRSMLVSLRWRNEAEDGGRNSSFLVPFGQAADWYGGFEIGAHSAADMDASAGARRWDYRTDAGPAVIGRLGYRVTPGLRVEAEGSYRSAAFGEIGGGMALPTGICSSRNANQGAPFDCTTGDGSIQSWSLLANGIYDFGDPDSALRPFIGAGVGFMQTSLAFGGKMRGVGSDNIDDYLVVEPDFSYYQIPSGVYGATADDTTTLAWQLLAGFSWRMTDRVTIDTTYRLLGSSGLSWKLQHVPGMTPEIGRFSSDLSDQSLTIGVRWAFGGR